MRNENGTYHTFAKDIARLVLPLTRDALKKRGFSEARLIQDWPDIVGAGLAKVSCPQKIAFEMNKKTDGVLHVDVLSASALEIQHMQPVILERIAVYFGYRAISRLVLHQTNRLPNGAVKPKKMMAPSSPPIAIDFSVVQSCEDEELKHHLNQIALSLSSSPPKNNR